jgi:hypothetical protein
MECPPAMRCRPGGEREERICQHPLPSPGALGAACQGDADCGSAWCRRREPDAAPTCTQPCGGPTPGRPILPCPEGFACRAVAGGGGLRACFLAGAAGGGRTSTDAAGGCGIGTARYDDGSPFLPLGAALAACILRRRGRGAVAACRDAMAAARAPRSPQAQARAGVAKIWFRRGSGRERSVCRPGHDACSRVGACTFELRRSVLC